MRLLLHDFAGHPFPAQLARALGRRGIDVDHAYCAGVTTGRGDLNSRPGDRPTVRFTQISDEPFERYSPAKRLRSEWKYGQRLAGHVLRTSPDVVLSGNTPLVSQAMLWRAARRVGARRVYWVQDFLGRGTRGVLAARSPLLGRTAGAGFEHLETRLLRSSDAAVVISDDFVTELSRRSVAAPVTTVENWAPLDEIDVRPKDNAWSRAHQLHDRSVAVYSGTLGLKHDPEHLLAAARAMRGTSHLLVVATEGRGRDHLEVERHRQQLEKHLLLLDYVDYADLPSLLGAANLCVVLLEAGAGTFSVPSKILAYLAAGRPIVAAVPSENLAAVTIRGAHAGLVTEPGDHTGFAESVLHLLENDGARRHHGTCARAYAEANFDIERITDRILAVLSADETLP